jgi:hypothetical protein
MMESSQKIYKVSKNFAVSFSDFGDSMERKGGESYDFPREALPTFSTAFTKTSLPWRKSLGSFPFSAVWET